MWHVAEKFKIILGGSTFVNVPHPIGYKGKSLITVKRSDSDGLFGIDFDVYDKAGVKVATIRNGMIVDGNKENYDVSVEMDRYRLIEKNSGRVVCDIKKRTLSPDSDLEISVRMYTYDGFLIDASDSKITINGNEIIGGHFENSKYGIGIE